MELFQYLSYLNLQIEGLERFKRHRVNPKGPFDVNVDEEAMMILVKPHGSGCGFSGGRGRSAEVGSTPVW